MRSKSALEHRRQKLTFHKKNYGPSFKEQDLVMLHSRKRSIDKLKSHWSGPYVIIKKINDVNFIMQNSNYRKKSKKSIEHYDRIKHYNHSFKDKRIWLPKIMPSDIQVAFSKITTEQPSVDVEKQSDDNYLLSFEPDEGSN